MQAMLRIALLALLFIPALCVVNPPQSILDENDNNVLRFALTLELLDATYFDHFQQVYTRQDFINAGLSGSVWDNLDLLRQQEEMHAAMLQDNLILRTGMKLPICQYNFSMVNSVYDYIGGARLLENVGTGAYDGSLPNIYNRSLQQAAATIATVEARHAAFLNQLPGNITLPSPVPSTTSPFPNATDFAFTPATVSDYIMPFILNCSYNVTAIFPTIYVVIPVAYPNSSFINPTQGQVNANDITALNYALSMELLQAALYSYLGTANFTMAKFAASNYTNDDYHLLQSISDHTKVHVTFLTDAVTARNGKPAADCKYSFGKFVNSTTTFVTIAQQISNTIVAAFDGSINTITDPGLRQAVATIATVEARQAAFLNALTNAPAFPAPLDAATPPSDVISLVMSNYISSCDTPIQAPQPSYVVPISNETTTTGASSSVASTSGASGTTSLPTSAPGTTQIGATTATSSAPSSSTGPTPIPPVSVGASSSTTGEQATSSAAAVVLSVVLCAVSMAIPVLVFM